MINIEYNKKKVEDKEIEILSVAIQGIVSKITDIKDVFVYANYAHIEVNSAPIEIFVRMTVELVPDKASFLKQCKEHLLEWKKSNNFSQPINLTVIPMDWKFEVNI